MLREFITGIKNLWAWFPIIWKDRDWDGWFIYQIIEFKLTRQSKYIGKMDRHVRAQKDARDMLICSKLIAKVKDEYYELEYFDYHKSAIRYTKIVGFDDRVEMDIDLVYENFDSYFNKYPKWHSKAVEFIKKNQDFYNVDYLAHNKPRAHFFLQDLRTIAPSSRYWLQYLGLNPHFLYTFLLLPR